MKPLPQGEPRCRKASNAAGTAAQSKKPTPAGRAELTEAEICRLVRLRHQHPNSRVEKLQDIYRQTNGEPPCETAIKRVLERCGLFKQPRVRRVNSEALRSNDPTPNGPNDLWTIDFKCQWYHRGRQAEPMIVRDEFSRFVLEASFPPDAATETIKGCFESLFKRYGLPGRIRSETATPFGTARSLLGLSKLSAWWLALGIDLEWKRPDMDQGNGFFERPYLSMNRQWDPVSFAERQSELDAWRLNFNEQRPHKAIGMQVPSAVYTSSSKPYSGTPDALEYPGLDCRKVLINGTIGFNSVKYFITSALAGWDIGLRPLGDGRVEVKFAALSLGIIDPKLHEFLPTSSDLLVRGPDPSA